MEGPLNIERDVVKNGVRLDCVFEAMSTARREKKSEASGLPGLDVWRSQKTPGFLWNRSRILPGTGPAGNGELPVTATGWVGGTALSSVRTDSRAEREQWSETVLFSSLPGGILQAA